MSTSLLGTFESSLESLEVTHERTPPSGLADAVREAVVEPAVAAPLPWDDLSLDGADLTREPTPAELADAETGVTAAGAGIAAEGSLVIQSRPGGDEPVSLYPPRHVAIVRAADLVPDIAAGLEWLAEEFDAGRTSAVLETGPSATADMGAMVTGVHGPGELRVITVTEP